MLTKETCQILTNPARTPKQKLIRGRKVSHCFPSCFSPPAVYPKLRHFSEGKMASSILSSLLRAFSIVIYVFSISNYLSGYLSNALSKQRFATFFFVFVMLLDLCSPLSWFTLSLVWLSAIVRHDFSQNNTQFFLRHCNQQSRFILLRIARFVTRTFSEKKNKAFFPRPVKLFVCRRYILQLENKIGFSFYSRRPGRKLNASKNRLLCFCWTWIDKEHRGLHGRNEVRSGLKGTSRSPRTFISGDSSRY